MNGSQRRTTLAVRRRVILCGALVAALLGGVLLLPSDRGSVVFETGAILVGIGVGVLVGFLVIRLINLLKSRLTLR